MRRAWSHFSVSRMCGMHKFKGSHVWCTRSLHRPNSNSTDVNFQAAYISLFFALSLCSGHQLPFSLSLSSFARLLPLLFAQFCSAWIHNKSCGLALMATTTSYTVQVIIELAVIMLSSLCTKKQKRSKTSTVNTTSTSIIRSQYSSFFLPSARSRLLLPSCAEESHACRCVFS